MLLKMVSTPSVKHLSISLSSSELSGHPGCVPALFLMFLKKPKWDGLVTENQPMINLVYFFEIHSDLSSVSSNRPKSSTTKKLNKTANAKHIIILHIIYNMYKHIYLAPFPKLQTV